MQTSAEYDALFYEGAIFSKTKPGHLATMAFLHGLSPVPPAECRVLELGCGDGLNLLSQAYGLPHSEFVGIDLSAAHIDAANAYAEKLGAKNIEFKHADILTLDLSELGKFDYIVAHGLYSWIPDQVRAKTLELYSECLAENGVGYISFNTYPGCRLREMLWDGLRYYTHDLSEPTNKVETARLFAQVLQRSINDDKYHKDIYAREIEKLEERPVQGVFHDDLSPALRPFYFHEFASHLEQHELQFVCEADPVLSFTGSLNETAINLLETFREDRIRYEQTIDFIQCRRFRSSIICGSDHRVEQEVDPDRITQLYLRCDFAASVQEDSLLDESDADFRSQRDESITIRDPFLKLTFQKIRDAWPRKVHYGEIVSALRGTPQLAAVPNFEERLAKLTDPLKLLFLSECFQLSMSEIGIAEAVGERPTCSAFARLQIERGSQTICSLDGYVFDADNVIVRELISLADGTRDRDQLIAEISENLEVEPGKQEEFLSGLPKLVDETLNELRISGVLLP